MHGGDRDKIANLKFLLVEIQSLSTVCDENSVDADASNANNCVCNSGFYGDGASCNACDSNSEDADAMMRPLLFVWCALAYHDRTTYFEDQLHRIICAHYLQPLFRKVPRSRACNTRTEVLPDSNNFDKSLIFRYDQLRNYMAFGRDQ